MKKSIFTCLLIGIVLLPCLSYASSDSGAQANKVIYSIFMDILAIKENFTELKDLNVNHCYSGLISYGRDNEAIDGYFDMYLSRAYDEKTGKNKPTMEILLKNIEVTYAETGEKLDLYLRVYIETSNVSLKSALIEIAKRHTVRNNEINE